MTRLTIQQEQEASRDLAEEIFPGGDMRMHIVEDDVAELFPMGHSRMPCMPVALGETYGSQAAACGAARSVLENDPTAGLDEAMAAYNSTLASTYQEQVELGN